MSKGIPVPSHSWLIRRMIGLLAVLYTLAHAPDSQAQYVWNNPTPEVPQHQIDFWKSIEYILRPHEEYIKKIESGYFDPRPEAMVRPTPGSQNPDGRLVMAFRIGPIRQFQLAEFNGAPASEKTIREAKLNREGGLLEFYEDGTFLHVINGHVAFPDHYPSTRGTFTRTGNRMEFKASATGSGPYMTVKQTISGVVVIGPNGTAQVSMTEEILNFGSVTFRGQLVNQWNNQFRLRYAVSLTLEAPARGVPPFVEAPVRQEPPQPPTIASLTGAWQSRKRLSDGREITWLLAIGEDGSCLLGIAGDPANRRFPGRYDPRSGVIAVNFGGNLATSTLILNADESLSMVDPVGQTVFVRIR